MEPGAKFTKKISIIFHCKDDTVIFVLVPNSVHTGILFTLCAYQIGMVFFDMAIDNSYTKWMEALWVGWSISRYARQEVCMLRMAMKSCTDWKGIYSSDIRYLFCCNESHLYIARKENDYTDIHLPLGYQHLTNWCFIHSKICCSGRFISKLNFLKQSCLSTSVW